VPLELEALRLTQVRWQAGTKATLSGKAVTVTFKDKNTLTFITPALAFRRAAIGPYECGR